MKRGFPDCCGIINIAPAGGRLNLRYCVKSATSSCSGQSADGVLRNKTFHYRSAAAAAESVSFSRIRSLEKNLFYVDYIMVLWRKYNKWRGICWSSSRSVPPPAWWWWRWWCYIQYIGFLAAFLCEIFTLRPLDDVTFTLDDIIVQHMQRFWVISAANNCATVWCAIVESIASK